MQDFAHYSRKHTNIKLAAQAASSATVSATCSPSPDVLKVVPMTGKTSGGRLKDLTCADRSANKRLRTSW